MPDTVLCLDMKAQLPSLEQGAYEILASVEPGFALAKDGTALSLEGFSGPGTLDILYYVSDEQSFGAQIDAQAAGPRQVDTEAVQDPVANKLMRAYGHRPVWFYGDKIFWTQSNFYPCAVRLTSISPVEITGIYRFKNDRTQVPLGDDPWGAHFLTRTPLLVELDTNDDKLEYLQLAGSHRPGDRCFSQKYLYVADRWDFERIFSLKDPVAQFSSGDRRGQLISTHVAAPNMTREMVAFSLGYPARFGTVEELNRLSKWIYSSRNGYPVTVTFDGDYATQVVYGESTP